MKNVVIGVLGTVLDNRGKGENRWQHWRPTISLCMQPGLVIDRLELLYNTDYRCMAEKIRNDIIKVSPATEVVLQSVDMTDPWDFEQVYTTLLDFANNYPFHPEQENYLIHITTGTHVAQICFFLLTESRHFPATLIQTFPNRTATDDLPSKIVGGHTIIDLDLSRYDQIAARFKQQQYNALNELKAGISTRSKAFNQMIQEIEHVAIRSSAPILLTGPTGAGKSFLARRIYELKHLRHQVDGAFIEVNCATLRGDNAMSALFGHCKGAYTGAQTERLGLLRTADNGVLFLDEIGELGLDEQAMLLKAIEEKRFYPFGSDKEVSSSFQLIAGTHRNLQQHVSEGKFREDLYARINLWKYYLPGLAERREDIEPNLEYELLRYAQDNGEQVRFSSEAKTLYLNFAVSPQALWTGNFRELSASVTRMATLSQSGNITTDVVKHEINRLKQGWFPPIAAQNRSINLSQPIDLFDACQLQHVITICQESKTLSEAGRKLFAVSRQSKQNPNDADRLRKYLARFDLSWESIKSQVFAE